MQVNINDDLYQQLSDYAGHVQLNIGQLIEKEMTKLLKRKEKKTKHSTDLTPRIEKSGIRKRFAENCW